MVTLAACDASNQMDTITPKKSIAHALHVSGLPVGVASQLPLTKQGSNILVHHFKDKAGRRESRGALERARDWYRLAFNANPPHHWSGVQYLALNAALTGKVDAEDWKTAYRVAEVDCRHPNELM